MYILYFIFIMLKRIFYCKRILSCKGKITIQELFPLYETAIVWGDLTKKEHIRLLKEYTIKEISDDSIDFTVDDKYHRIDGPAHTVWYNEMIFEEFYEYGIYKYSVYNKRFRFDRTNIMSSIHQIINFIMK